LGALVIRTVAHAKSNASILKKARDKKDGQSFGLDVDPIYFCGIYF
jgi:hypothetical protein